MRATLAALYRHPVKSLGEEAVGKAVLTPGRAMPWDRIWAVAHGASAFDPDRPEWVRARNFVTQTHLPELARIAVRYDEGAGQLTLSHPQVGPVELDLGTAEGAQALTDWLAPLAQGFRPGPYRLCRLTDGALTDFPDSHLHIASTRSLAVLGQMAGRVLEPIRFRANLWLDGLDPWEEWDLVGREIRIGPARLRITDRTTRCNATAASPATGQRDTPVPDLLEGRWGHRDFGVYAQVIEGGTIAPGDAAVPA